MGRYFIGMVFGTILHVDHKFNFYHQKIPIYPNSLRGLDNVPSKDWTAVSPQNLSHVLCEKHPVESEVLGETVNGQPGDPVGHWAVLCAARILWDDTKSLLSGAVKSLGHLE